MACACVGQVTMDYDQFCSGFRVVHPASCLKLSNHHVVTHLERGGLEVGSVVARSSEELVEQLWDVMS